MIIYGKVTHDIFHSIDGTFHIVAVLRDGHKRTLPAVYVGEDPPKPLKTVSYEFRGEEEDHPKYGKRFRIDTFKRSDVKMKTPFDSLNRHTKRVEQDANKHMRDL